MTTDEMQKSRYRSQVSIRFRAGKTSRKRLHSRSPVSPGGPGVSIHSLADYQSDNCIWCILTYLISGTFE